ncbi:hypothetical protein COOONC_11446, partial [Cooperia oncophora]
LKDGIPKKYPALSVFEFITPSTTLPTVYRALVSSLFDYPCSQYYSTSNFTILLYSGDVDTMCNWMGAEWFTTQYFGNTLNLGLQQRQPWYYQSDPQYVSTLGGYARKYAKNIDVLTVKGSGHFVPLDRPAQALQMIYNWIQRANYSTPYVQMTSTTTSPASTSSSTVPPQPTGTGTTQAPTNVTQTPGSPAPSNSTATPGSGTTATATATSPKNNLGTSPTSPAPPSTAPQNLGTSPTSPAPQSTTGGGSVVYSVYTIISLIILCILQYYSTSNFTILLYSGDVDTMCNWMGAEWFTTQYFGNTLNLGLQQRQPWYYQSDPQYVSTLGGYARKYAKNIDVLTVKVSPYW